MVTAGYTVMEPLSGTAAPFSLAFTAFLVVHAMTDDWRRLIDDALALTPAAGTTGPFDVCLTRFAPTAVLASFSESRFHRAGESACNA